MPKWVGFKSLLRSGSNNKILKRGFITATGEANEKNIVIFSDGTGQEGGEGFDTNIYKLFVRVTYTTAMPREMFNTSK